MLSLRASISMGLALALFLAGPAVAQAPEPVRTQDSKNAGIGEKAESPKDVDKGQNMILPSAGESTPSAAPTMVFDCQKKPEDCRTPATPADKAGASQSSPIKP